MISDILLFNSPCWHLELDSVLHVEIRNVTVRTDRQKQQALKQQWRELRRQDPTFSRMEIDAELKGFPLQPEDLNTDGFDIRGRDVWVHNCSILNDDDSVAIKPTDATNGPYSNCTRDMLLEDMVMTGFGASIGSVPPNSDVNCVQNITFRNIVMPGTGKGIYVKSNPSCGPNKTALIADITYENVHIIEPRWCVPTLFDTH